MILIKYILKEMFKNQLIILLLLFLVCFCQKLIKMLNLVVDSNISIYLIFLYLGLNVPELGKLLIPFSVFISVLITLYRLHLYNEIMAMYCCAVDKCILIRSVLFFSSIVAVFAMINLAWLSPYCVNYQNKLLYAIKEGIGLVILSEKKFQLLYNKYLILFADSIQRNKLEYIFLAKTNSYKHNSALTIIIADQGNIYSRCDSSQLFILEKGTYYRICERCELCRDFFITNFDQHRMLIPNMYSASMRKNKFVVDHMSIYRLCRSIEPEAHIELHWRLTLLISIFIMPIITTLLMISNSYNNLIIFLLILCLYIIFFLSHTLIRIYAMSEKINPMVWVWTINSVYLLIIVLINWWDNFCIKKYFLKRVLS